MSDFIGDKECVTHHHACDCREAKFRAMEWENNRVKELLMMADAQLRFIGCFAGCDQGVIRCSDGQISQCQCCHEQEQIEQFLEPIYAMKGVKDE